ncbi:hypothetical protein MJH12_11995, partial [bacterium]|nr:hypothetical protein [bacterium]
SPLIIMDGSHNPMGIQQVADWLKINFPDYQIQIAIALKSNKSHHEMISLLQDVGEVSIYKPRSKGFLSIEQFPTSIPYFKDYQSIYSHFFKSTKKKKLLLFTGSLKSAIIQKRYFKKYQKQQKIKVF